MKAKYYGVILLASTMVAFLAPIASSEGRADASGQLELLAKTLEALVDGDYIEAREIAETLLKAPGHGSLRWIAARVYQRIVVLADTLQYVEDSIKKDLKQLPRHVMVLEKLRVEIPDMLQHYVDLLLRELGNYTLRTYYRERLYALIEMVREVIEDKLYTIAYRHHSSHIHVVVEPLRVLGGENITVKIVAPPLPKLWARIVLEVAGHQAAWTLIELENGYGEAALKTPSASTLKVKAGAYTGRVSVTVFNSTTAIGYATATFEIIYLEPGVKVYVLKRVEPYSSPTLVVETVRPAALRVEIDGMNETVFEIEPPGANITLWPLPPGEHSLRITVEPWGPYTGYTFWETVVVGVEPIIQVTAVPVQVNLIPLIEMNISIWPKGLYKLAIRINGIDTSTRLVFAGNKSIKVLALPALFTGVAFVEIKAQPAEGGWKTATTTIVYAVSIIMLAFYTLTGFTLSLIGSQPYITIPMAIRLEESFRRVKAPTAAGLKLRFTPSRAIRIYYRVLGLLKLPKPLPHETLREHYLRVKTRLSQKAAKALWELLVLVEKDLYSRVKPSRRLVEAKARRVVREAK